VKLAQKERQAVENEGHGFERAGGSTAGQKAVGMYLIMKDARALKGLADDAVLEEFSREPGLLT